MKIGEAILPTIVQPRRILSCIFFPLRARRGAPSSCHFSISVSPRTLMLTFARSFSLSCPPFPLAVVAVAVVLFLLLSLLLFLRLLLLLFFAPALVPVPVLVPFSSRTGVARRLAMARLAKSEVHIKKIKGGGESLT